MQNGMKPFSFKWVSLTFLGVEPNPGFWPGTATGSCWCHNGQLCPCSALHPCSLPERLHQLHIFAGGMDNSATQLCALTASCCCNRLMKAQLPRGHCYWTITSLSWKYNSASPLGCLKCASVYQFSYR